MKKILKFLNDYLEETICIILMSVMTIIIFIQVIMRYVMHPEDIRHHRKGYISWNRAEFT